jgi:xanthine dehydrogenase molybdenum-binding subunit
MNLPEAIPPRSLLGCALPKPDAVAKATGRTRYINDMTLPRMLHARILRAGRGHARIVSIDTAAARSLRGVHAVLTAADVAARSFGFAGDQLPLKSGKIRSVRDEVAAVAAETEAIAEIALALIEVNYEDLPVLATPEAASAPGAVLIHEGRDDNNHLRDSFDHGDIGSAEAASDVTVTATFELPFVAHCCMGTSCVIAETDADGGLTLYSQTQAPHHLQKGVAQALGMNPGDVRIVQPPVGGAFGAKTDMYAYEPICALLAFQTGRPVKLAFSREEEFVASPTRQPLRIRFRAGARADGTFTFRDADCLIDNGAYTSWGPLIPFVMTRTFSSLFRADAVRVRSRSVYTNNPFSGAFRGYGNVQASFAMGVTLDMLAEKLGMDPVALMLANAQREGEVSPQGSRFEDCALEACIRHVAEVTDFQARHEAFAGGTGRLRRGIGIACTIHNGGGAKLYPSDGCGTILKFDDAGRCTVITGASEIGQGIDATIAILTAETLGLPAGHVRVVQGDTAITPWDMGAKASRSTFIAGNSAVRAARKAREQILAAAESRSNVSRALLDLRDGHVVQLPDGIPVVSIGKLLREMHYGPEPELVMVTDYYEPPTQMEGQNHQGEVSAAWAHAAYVAEVEVDTHTGVTRVVGVTVAQDVGRVVSGLGLRGQIEGGVAIGLGYALSEELMVRSGQVLNAGFRDYKIMTAPEMPPVSCHFIESNSRNGPYGAKGAAEIPCVATPPAVANAISNAIGVRMFAPPFTPEKLCRALEAAARDPFVSLAPEGLK